MNIMLNETAYMPIWQKGGRMNTYALKYYLKEIGFDYDAVCEKKLKENVEKKEENRQ